MLTEVTRRMSNQQATTKPDADVLDAIHFCDNRIAVFSERAEDGEWIRADIEDCIDQQVWA
jgi:TFIIF-interacting CTD phosphatase-like protein